MAVNTNIRESALTITRHLDLSKIWITHLFTILLYHIFLKKSRIFLKNFFGEATQENGTYISLHLDLAATVAVMSTGWRQHLKI